MKYLPFLLAGLLFSSSAIAVPENTIAPIYEVEILVFKNLRIEDQETELWLQDIDPGKQPDVSNASLAGGGIPANSEIRKISEKLLASGNYSIISHKRWIQDAIPKTEARLIRIANGEVKLDGTVLFYKSRFLHIDMNLALKEEFIPVTETGSNGGDQGNTANFFIINEHRRVRSASLNYFDHPRFGVIIQINLVKASTH